MADEEKNSTEDGRIQSDKKVSWPAIFSALTALASTVAAGAAAVAAYAANMQTTTYVAQVRLENQISGCKSLVSSLYDLREADNFQFENEQYIRNKPYSENSTKSKKANTGLENDSIDNMDSIYVRKNSVNSFERYLKVIYFSLDYNNKKVVSDIIITLKERENVIDLEEIDFQKYREWRNGLDKLIDSANENCSLLVSADTTETLK